MSLMPEFVIQKVLAKGISAFRKDERLIRMLFRHLEQKDVQEIVKFFRDRSIDISINYPDKDVVIPFIAILLNADNEEQAFLGELQEPANQLRPVIPGHLQGNSFPTEELRGDQTVLGSGSTSTVDGIVGSGNLYVEPVTALSGDVDTIDGPSSITKLIDPFEEQVYVVILEGTGAGQKRQVVSITPSANRDLVEFKVLPIWDTIPDNTSIFKVVGGPDTDGGVGEPPALYREDELIERLGQLYRCRYRLDIAAYPQELMIYIHTVVKAIMIISRHLLQKQGFINLQMSSSDLDPITEGYPQLIYRRSLNLEFVNSFDIFAELVEPVAKQIQLALSVHDPDIGDSNGLERVVLNTTFDVS